MLTPASRKINDKIKNDKINLKHEFDCFKNRNSKPIPM